MLRPCTCVVPNEILRHGGKWAEVVAENSTVGSSSGVEIRLEYSGDGLGPIAGDYDQVVMYDSPRPRGEEIVRYDLNEIERSLYTRGESA